MRILLVHNRYQQRGGEDVVFESETELLARHGHDVRTLVFDNRDIDTRSLVGKARLAASTVWSRTGARRVREATGGLRAEVVHFHNTFPLVSPAAYRAARNAGAAVVQTLHNYRLLCPAATFFRDGHPCEDCLGKTPPWPGVLHACYRGSRSQTGVTAAMLTFHRLRRTYQKEVDAYIALTDFAARKHVAGGIPSDRLAIKGNFLEPDPGPGQGPRAGFLYSGRLAPEKGIAVLLEAWRWCGEKLIVIGDGLLRDDVVKGASNTNIAYLGGWERDSVLQQMRSKTALIFPSIYYEGFPITLLEAFASGLPVIASRTGSLAEIVEDGRTGLLFAPGDAADLRAKVLWAASHPGEMAAMGNEARAAYERKYRGETNYRELIAIYERAIETSGDRRKP